MFKAEVSEINISGLQSQLKSDIESAVRDELQTETYRVFEQTIMSVLGSGTKGIGESYANTHQMVNAVDIKVTTVGSGRAEFELWMNPDNINIIPYSSTYPLLGAYGGVHGEDAREIVLKALDTGSSGSPIYNHQGTGYMEEAYTNVDTIAPRVLATAISNKGWNVNFYS